MKTSAKNYFVSVDNPNEHYSLDEVIYKGRDGSLLEVCLDPEYLTSKHPNEWRELFDGRLGSVRFPYNSGVWNKKEWVLPDLTMENIVSLQEGNTNLLLAKRLGEKIGLERLWIKQCGITHTASFKDLGMTVLVSQVRQMMTEGKSIQAVGCASTGDTSAALSAYAAWIGIPAIVFLPADKITLSQLLQPIANGAYVISLQTDFDGCMKIIQEVTRDKSIYLANSMNSLRVEGQKTISMEICQQLEWVVPDYIIIPGGNLGNVSALGKGFKEMKTMGLIERFPRIVVAQAENANPLYQAHVNRLTSIPAIEAKTTQASAIQIGNPVSSSKALRILQEFDGIVEQASEAELANASALSDMYGFFNCPHTGVAMATLLKLLERKIISKKDKVVVISTAHGLKFPDFKLNYHQEKDINFQALYPNRAIEMPADVDTVKQMLKNKIFQANR